MLRDETEGPDLDRRAWAETVSTQLQRLSDTHATALRLVYGHQLPQREVAAWMGLTASQVSTVLSEALLTLGTMLTYDV